MADRGARPPLLSDAKGIFVVCLRGPTWPVSRWLLEHPAENVVPVLVGASPPGLLPSEFGNAPLPFEFVNGDTHRRLLLVVDDAGALSAPQLTSLISVLRKGVGVGFNFKVRIQLVVNVNSGFSWAPFYTSPKFVHRDFINRVMVAAVDESLSHLAADEALGEFVERVCGDPHGADPSDAWVSGQVAAQNAAKPTPASLRSGGVVTLAAATRGSLDRAVCSLADCLSEGNTDYLVAAYSFLSGSGGEGTATVRFPYGLRSSDGPLGYATVLEVVATGLPKGLGEGTRIIWEGRTEGDEIFDEDTLEDGAHATAPAAVSGPSESPITLVGHRTTAAGDRVSVSVPLFFGSPATVAVRPVGLAVGADQTDAVAGHVVGRMGPAKGGPRLMLCPEPYTVEQYCNAFSEYTGRLSAVTSAPGRPGDRLCLNYSAPAGSAPARTRHVPAMRIKRTKRFGLGSSADV